MDLICKYMQGKHNRIVFNDLGGLLGGAALYFTKICH